MRKERRYKEAMQNNDGYERRSTKNFEYLETLTKNKNNNTRQKKTEKRKITQRKPGKEK